MECLRIWEVRPDDIISEEQLTVNKDGKKQMFRKNDAFSTAVHLAVQNQNDIGWENFIVGRISKCWGEAQEIYYRFRKMDRKHSGATWATKMVQIMWGYAEDIWLQRNECTYGVGVEALHKQRKELRPKVMALYDDYKDKVRRSDHAFFQVNLEDRMRRHPKMIKRWMRIVKLCISKYKKEKKRECDKRNKITKCFQKKNTIYVNKNGKPIREKS